MQFITFHTKDLHFFSLLLSSSFKIYLLTEIFLGLFRNSLAKKFAACLIAFLIGSLFGDFSHIAMYLHNQIPWVISKGFINGIIRISWAFFLVHFQALTLFLDWYGSEQRIKIKARQLFFAVISVSVGLLFLYFAITQAPLASENPGLFLLEPYLYPLSSMLLLPMVFLSVYDIHKRIRTKSLSKIARNQLQVFIYYLILPYTLLEIITDNYTILNSLSGLLFVKKHVLMCASTLILTYALYFCCKKLMGLRFMNFNSQVDNGPKKSFNFINDFKEILEQLSYVSSVGELNHMTQLFFQKAYSIPLGRTKLYIRASINDKKEQLIKHDAYHAVTHVESFFMKYGADSHVMQYMHEQKILIRDEIEFTNHYEPTDYRSEIILFLDKINADIFLPIYERHAICAYIIIERDARGQQLYTRSEKDEMLVFTSYLNNIISIMRHGNLEALLKHQKDLEEELYHKHHEINQYKESIRSFLKTNHERKVGVIFYKGHKFNFANQAAYDLIEVDLNSQHGHPFAIACKQIVRKVYQYKTAQSTIITDPQGTKLMLSAIPSLDEHMIILLVYYPEISDIISKQFGHLKDPSQWDYVLYLETTNSGQLINQLIPSNGPVLLNFKINLLAAALSKKAILLEIHPDDIEQMVDILHHISLRQTLSTIKLTTSEQQNEISIKLFGTQNLTYISEYAEESVLEKLNGTGTLFIENIEYLSLETQHQLAQFISTGLYYKYKTDQKYRSDVRIICSTTKKLASLVSEGTFSRELFKELHQANISLPSLSVLNAEEITELAHGYSEQNIQSHVFKNLFELSDTDTNRLLDKRPVSLQELKSRIQQLLTQKTLKHDIQEKIEFNPASQITDPEIAQAVRLGKKALKDPRVMSLLWNRFKNQNKIATLLGVNRSSVNRRCQEYGLIKADVPHHDSIE